VFTGDIIFFKHENFSCFFFFNFFLLLIGVNCDFPQFLARSNTVLYISTNVYNIRYLLLSNELSSSYNGVVISGLREGSTCKLILASCY
jgi:hypothetical protein